MTIVLSEQKFELTLDEINEIVDGRQKAAHMDENTMKNGEKNPLNTAWNCGVDCMAKYMRDWFQFKFYEATEGGEN